jgi:Glycoside hydrolase family 5 C-terminal domain/Cellulase (glycosyl hydrolase family 5)
VPKLAFTVGALALALSAYAQAQPIRVDGAAFKDPQGRTLILRGVNLGGTSKVPRVPTSDPRVVSFVGRPFPLAEADEHFRRLKSWGFTVERLIVPWEAIEHAGPGQYDFAYLEYLHALVGRARQYGIKVYIDLHQDLWSRPFGGDGAPYWTSQALGLGTDKSKEVGADPAKNSAAQDYWPPSSGRHAVMTMETLFWAGNDFAPGLKVDGVPVQDYLQSHYINAAVQVALRLHDLDNVIGFDLWNEPMQGYIGARDLAGADPLMAILGSFKLPNRPSPTYWDYFRAASGYEIDPQSVVKPDPIWMSEGKDIWRQFGVWDVVDGKPVLLKPNYFATVQGRPVDFNGYLKAFQLRYISAIRKVAPDALAMQELSILGGEHRAAGMALGVPGVVNEPHFYDAAEGTTRRYTPDVTSDFLGHTYSGRDAILDYFGTMLRAAKAEAVTLGGVPTLFGETGLRFNINDDVAFKTGDFSAQEAHARLLFDALDQAVASYTIWTYSPDNTNERGDLWSGEDFSIYSLSQRKNPADINSGGRALHQIVRPYPEATAGSPLVVSFDTQTRLFTYRFRSDPSVRSPTVIFVPKVQYPSGFTVAVEGGAAKAEPEQSRVSVTSSTGEVTVVVRPR